MVFLKASKVLKRICQTQDAVKRLCKCFHRCHHRKGPVPDNYSVNLYTVMMFWNETSRSIGLYWSEVTLYISKQKIQQAPWGWPRLSRRLLSWDRATVSLRPVLLPTLSNYVSLSAYRIPDHHCNIVSSKWEHVCPGREFFIWEVTAELGIYFEKMLTIGLSGLLGSIKHKPWEAHSWPPVWQSPENPNGWESRSVWKETGKYGEEGRG